MILQSEQQENQLDIMLVCICKASCRQKIEYCESDLVKFTAKRNCGNSQSDMPKGKVHRASERHLIAGQAKTDT